jgi:transketolase
LKTIDRGGYVLKEAREAGRRSIMASGSEVGLAVAAAQAYHPRCRVRVVSMPNPDLFLQQDRAYRESVLPPAVKARVAVEAGVSAYWRDWSAIRGEVIGIDRFGASAPAEALFEHYGLTSENVCRAVRESLAARRQQSELKEK